MFLLTIALVLLGVLFLHSLCVRGRSLTLSFFIYGLSWAALKEFSHSFAPYRFSPQNIFISKLLVVIGWVITFYLAWSIAEMVVFRLKLRSHRVFSLLLIAGFFVASISYLMEAHGPALGLWSWEVRHTPNPLCTLFFVGNCSLKMLEAWSYFGTVFLFSYAAVFCRGLRHCQLIWKPLVLLLPFAALHAIALRTPAFELTYAAVFLASLLIFREDGFSVAEHSVRAYAMLPAAVLGTIMLVLAAADLFIVRRPEFFISFLPATAIILLAVRRLPQSWVYIAALALSAALREKAVPVLVPLALVALMQMRFPYFSMERRSA